MKVFRFIKFCIGGPISETTSNVHFYFKNITEPWQCCNELELTWEIQSSEASLQILPGNYTKQSYLSNDKVVYYNSANGYFLYNVETEWVVSYGRMRTVIRKYYLILKMIPHIEENVFILRFFAR